MSVHRHSSPITSWLAHAQHVTCVLRSVELMEWDVSVSLLEPAYVKTKIASKQLGDKSPLRHVRDQQRLRDLYGVWASSVEAKRARVESFASPVSVTSDAIVHAMTSSHPHTRYVVAVVGRGIPAKVVVWLAYLLPDRIQDFFTAKF